MAASPNALELGQAGPDLVYTDNLELLDLSLRLEQSDAAPRLVVSDPETGARVPMDFVERGLMPYDPVLVPGRPIFGFVLARPGTYQIEHMIREAVVTLMPDTTTGR